VLVWCAMQIGTALEQHCIQHLLFRKDQLADTMPNRDLA